MAYLRPSLSSDVSWAQRLQEVEMDNQSLIQKASDEKHL